MLTVFWRLIDEVHKLVELWSNNDLSASIALLAGLCIIIGERVILTTSTSSETLRIHPILVLQTLHHAGGTQA